MIEAADVDAARRKALRLVFQRGLEFRRRLIPFGLVIELDDVTVRIAAAERRPMPHIAVGPADLEFGTLQRGDAALQRLRAARPQRHVPHARSVRCRQLERIALVVVPAAQIDRIGLAAADGHAHHVDKEFQALVGLRRQQFHVAEMGEIENRLRVHARPPFGSPQRSRQIVEQFVHGERPRNKSLLRGILADHLQRTAHFVRAESGERRRRGRTSAAADTPPARLPELVGQRLADHHHMIDRQHLVFCKPGFLFRGGIGKQRLQVRIPTFSPSTASSSPSISIWTICLPAGARTVVSSNSATWASSNVTQSIELRSTP